MTKQRANPTVIGIKVQRTEVSHVNHPNPVPDYAMTQTAVLYLASQFGVFKGNAHMDGQYCWLFEIKQASANGGYIQRTYVPVNQFPWLMPKAEERGNDDAKAGNSSDGQQ